MLIPPGNTYTGDFVDVDVKAIYPTFEASTIHGPISLRTAWMALDRKRIHHEPAIQDDEGFTISLLEETGDEMRCWLC